MNRHVLSVLCYLTLFFSHAVTTPTTCEVLRTSSICQPLLNYTSISTSSATTNSLCQIDVELFANRTLLPLLSIVKPSCQSPLAQIFCSFVYPLCTTNNGSAPAISLPCSNLCLMINGTGACDSNDIAAINLFISKIPSLSQLINCSSYPNSGSCYSPSPAFQLSPSNLPRLPTCEAYNGSVCADYVDYPIWSGPGHSTQAELETLLMETSAAKVFPDCYPFLMKYSCSQAFLPCDTTTLTQALAVSSGTPFLLQPQPAYPKLPCYSICTDYAQACGPYIAKFLAPVDSRLIPNCTSQGTLMGGNVIGCDGRPTGILDWPLNESIFYNSTFSSGAQGSNLVLQNQCNSLVKQAPPINCSYPLVSAPFTDFIGEIRKRYPTSPCELPVSPAYLASEYTTRVSSNALWLTVPGSIFLLFIILTWLVFPEKRKQRHILYFCCPLWVWITVLAFSFAAGDGDLTTILRKTETVPNQGFDPPNYCAFEGLISFFCGLQACMWWGIIAVDLFLKVGLEKKFTDHQEMIKARIYHSVAWGLPIFMTVLYLAAGGKFGASQISSTIFCIFTIDSPDWAQYFTFFAPLGITAISGGLLMMFVIFKIRRTILSTLDPNKPWTRNEVKIRNFIMRPLVFVLLKFSLFIWIFIFRVQISLDRSRITDIVTAWVTCLQNNNGQTENCGSQPEHIFNSTLYIGLHVVIGFAGTLVFILWGTMEDNFYLWYGFCTGKGRNYKKSYGGSRTTQNTEVPRTGRTHLERTRELSSANNSNYGEKAPPEELSPVATPSGATEMAYLYPTHQTDLTNSSDNKTNSQDHTPRTLSSPDDISSPSTVDQETLLQSSSNGDSSFLSTSVPVVPRQLRGEGSEGVVFEADNGRNDESEHGHALGHHDQQHQASNLRNLEGNTSSSIPHDNSDLTHWSSNPLQSFHEGDRA